MEGKMRKRKALTAIEWKRRAIKEMETAMEKKRKVMPAIEREIEMITKPKLIEQETKEGEMRKRKALTAIEWKRRAIQEMETAMEKKRKAAPAIEREIEMNSLSWRRGSMLGRGSFGTVSTAFFYKKEEQCQNQFPIYAAAVKSSLASQSSTLKEEALILSKLSGSEHIIRCLGHEFTMENNQAIYNVFLEYISGGTLADSIKSTPSGLHETQVRNYTTSILRGLSYIHSRGYVHCDIKPQNLLVCSASEVKIADFGLAKKAGEKVGFGQCGFRGTPLYLAPESVMDAEYEPAVDIWALGCVVVEMVTGKTAWEHPVDGKVFALLYQIGFTQRVPEITILKCARLHNRISNLKSFIR